MRTERIGVWPAPGRPASRRRQVGFTLIEIVVAFVLLTLVLSVSFEIFSRGMARAGNLEDDSRALMVAQSRLAIAAAEEAIKPSETAGDSDDRRFHWATSIRQYDEALQAGPNAPVTNAPVYAMYRIDVRVTWRAADTRDHALALSTLAVGARQ